MVSYTPGDEYMHFAFIQNANNTSEKSFVENIYYDSGYAIPETSTPSSELKFNGVTVSLIAKINGIAIASIAKVNGIA